MRCIPRAAIAVLYGLFAICAAAAEPTDSHAYTEGASRAGTPWRVITPKYPPWAAQTQQTGAVDVEGVVEGSGVLGAIEYKPDTPAAEVFVPALKQIVPHWRFNVLTGPDCMPTPEKVTVRVEFFFEGGAPRVFASYATRQAERPQGKKEGYDYKAKRVQPQYPHRPLRLGIEAVVFASLDVAASGEVTRINVEAHSPSRIDAAVRNDFEEESRKALKGWRYSPNPANWRGCYTIVFNLKD